jgi:hypothetical protein
MDPNSTVDMTCAMTMTHPTRTGASLRFADDVGPMISAISGPICACTFPTSLFALALFHFQLLAHYPDKSKSTLHYDALKRTNAPMLVPDRQYTGFIPGTNEQWRSWRILTPKAA